MNIILYSRDQDGEIKMSTRKVSQFEVLYHPHGITWVGDHVITGRVLTFTQQTGVSSHQ